MKKTFILLTAAIVGLSLSACSSNSEPAEKKLEISQSEVAGSSQTDSAETAGSSSTVQAVDFPSQYNEEVNDVIFETSLEVPDNLDFQNLKRSTAKLQYPDTDTSRQLFGNGKEIAQEEENTMEGPNGPYQSWYGSFTDGSSLMTGSLFSYSTSFSGKITNYFSPSEDTGSFSVDQPFSFVEPEAAYQSILDTLHQLGYSDQESSYTCYSLDYQTLQGLTQGYSIKDTTEDVVEWSEADNCYYFFARQQHQGLPVYTGSADFPQDDIISCPVQAIYSANGLERLSVANYYEITQGEDVIQLLDFSAIAKKIGEKYGNILTGAQYTVNRAALYQAPCQSANGYDMKIAWLVVTTESGTDSETGEAYSYQLYSLIDAETGEELTI